MDSRHKSRCVHAHSLSRHLLNLIVTRYRPDIMSRLRVWQTTTTILLWIGFGLVSANWLYNLEEAQISYVLEQGHLVRPVNATSEEFFIENIDKSNTLIEKLAKKITVSNENLGNDKQLESAMKFIDHVAGLAPDATVRELNPKFYQTPPESTLWGNLIEIFTGGESEDTIYKVLNRYKNTTDYLQEHGDRLFTVGPSDNAATIKIRRYTKTLSKKYLMAVQEFIISSFRSIQLKTLKTAINEAYKSPGERSLVRRKIAELAFYNYSMLRASVLPSLALS